MDMNLGRNLLHSDLVRFEWISLWGKLRSSGLNPLYRVSQSKFATSLYNGLNHLNAAAVVEVGEGRSHRGVASGPISAPLKRQSSPVPNCRGTEIVVVYLRHGLPLRPNQPSFTPVEMLLILARCKSSSSSSASTCLLTSSGISNFYLSTSLIKKEFTSGLISKDGVLNFLSSLLDV